MRPDRLRVALVGCGQIADAHLQELRRVATASVVAVCDVHLDIARQAATRFQVPTAFDNVTRMLEDIRPDIVHITTPPHTHQALTLECLGAGSHVYVEKPLSVDGSQAERMIDAADARGLRLCLGHDQLFDPAWREFRQRLSSGEFGEIVHIDAVQGYDLGGPFGRLLRDDPGHWVHRLPGGLFQNVISHALARILDVMPDDGPRVLARWFRSDPDYPFPTELRVLLEGTRSTGALTFSTRLRSTRRVTRVLGTRRTVEIDLDARAITADAATTLPGAFAKTEVTWLRFSASARNLAVNLSRLSRGDLHYFEGMRTLFETFHRAILTGVENPVAHAEALRVTRVMDLVFEACRAGDPATSMPQSSTMELAS